MLLVFPAVLFNSLSRLQVTDTKGMQCGKAQGVCLASLMDESHAAGAWRTQALGPVGIVIDRLGPAIVEIGGERHRGLAEHAGECPAHF